MEKTDDQIMAIVKQINLREVAQLIVNFNDQYSKDGSYAETTDPELQAHINHLRKKEDPTVNFYSFEW